ncbi:MAG: alpha/beta hydrolase [Anaerolineaceae bacterium]|nr:alpha/beta hydrolase [Anaerolineaceae bacterium]
MHDHRVKVNQIDLQIRDYEHPGDAIIFLHFGGANLMMWQRIISDFQDQYRLVLVDLRGHGRSDKPDTGYHMDDMASDVIGIMKYLKLERAHIVGSSLGAEVGLSLAANYPEKVISLVCDGALSSEFGPYGTWEGTETEFEEHVASKLEELRNTSETIFPSIDALVGARREVFEKYGWWNNYVEAVERYGVNKVGEGIYMRGMGKQARENYMLAYFHYHFEDYYRKIKCPLLMLAEKELENEREKAAMMGLRDLAKQAEIAEISGWVHPYGWLLNPKGASQAILKFLSGTAQ